MASKIKSKQNLRENPRKQFLSRKAKPVFLISLALLSKYDQTHSPQVDYQKQKNLREGLLMPLG